MVRASHPGCFNHGKNICYHLNNILSEFCSYSGHFREEKNHPYQESIPGLSRGDLVTILTELTATNIADGMQGWPALQIQLLQELVVAARRMGHSALATRHMTFLLQTMWDHLLPAEQRDLALQLQVLAAQCEGAPVPLVLNSGIVIPPANLTNLPQIR